MVSLRVRDKDVAICSGISQLVRIDFCVGLRLQCPYSDQLLLYSPFEVRIRNGALSTLEKGVNCVGKQAAHSSVQFKMARAHASSHALTSITKIPFKPSTANETANNSMLVMMARFDRARASGFFVLVSRMRCGNIMQYAALRNEAEKKHTSLQSRFTEEMRRRIS
eukprot:scaffold69335_cov65-Cyclotella_meneghiniana.AAC.5